MILRIALCLSLAAGLPAQEAPRGSISGVVLDTATGTPIEGAMVYASDGSKQIDAKADPQGRFELKDLAPGLYRLLAYSKSDSALKMLTVAPGQKLDSIQLRLLTAGTIMGRVIDENKEPVPNLWVQLVQRVHYFGEIRYSVQGIATTDDRGEYRLTGAVPGRAYLVLAKRRPAAMDPVSAVPADPKLRRPVVRPTYYPNSPSIAGAETMVLRPGEPREGIDIGMMRGSSYCIEGVMDAAPGASFQISEKYPSNGDIGPVLMGAGVYFGTPYGKTGPDGKIRICDLHPGDYQLGATQTSNRQADLFATMPVTIHDQDVRDLRLVAQPGFTLPGRVAWDGTPPDNPVESEVRIAVASLTRGASKGVRQSAQSSVPGEFSFPSLFLDDYAVRVSGLPRDLYVKDVTYAGRSVLHEPLRLGSSVGTQELRVVVARDGGFLTVSVRGKENKPVPDSSVFIIPANAVSEAEMASSLVVGQADQNGVYGTTALAPGRYYVLAGGMLADTSPETMGTLWRARLTRAKDVQIEPRASVQVTVEPATGP